MKHREVRGERLIKPLSQFFAHESCVLLIESLCLLVGEVVRQCGKDAQLLLHLLRLSERPDFDFLLHQLLRSVGRCIGTEADGVRFLVNTHATPRFPFAQETLFLHVSEYVAVEIHSKALVE